MAGSKIVNILKTFDEKEIEGLRLFLQSPFFKVPLHVDKLFVFFDELYPDLDDFTPELAFKYTFPERKKFNGPLFNNIISKLLKQIEIFMAHWQLKHNEREQKLLALRSYRKKNHFLIFEKKTKVLRSEIDSSDLKGSKKHEIKFHLLYDYYFHPGTPKYTQGKEIIADLQAELDHFYLQLKLKIASELALRNKLLSEKNTSFLLPEVLKYSRKQTAPFYKIYLTVYDMLTQSENAIKLFNKAFRLYAQHRQELDSDYQASILQVLLNQSNQLAISEGIVYRKKQLELYKIGIEEGLFILNKQISEQMFFNIVSTASILHEFNFAKTFISNYSRLLDKTAKADTTNLSKAFLFFHQGHYKKADGLFTKTPLKNPIQRLLANSLHLRCLLELALEAKSYTDVFMNFSATFRKQISRSKLLSPQRKDSYYNLIEIARILIRSKTKKEKQKEKLFLKTEKMLQKKVIAKEWLKKKANIVFDRKLKNP